MPIFKWNAIDLNGTVHSGIDFANSKKELEVLLQNRKLGLMYCATSRKDLFNNKIKILDQLNFFYDLKSMLIAGIPLPQALQLLLNQSKKPQLRCIVGYLLYQVQEQGSNFGVILQRFKTIFGSLVVVALKVSFNVGNLAQGLQNVCTYLDNKLQMQRALRSALLMPILTLVLFIGIAILVFMVIVPQIAIIFENAKVPLDYSTTIVLNISAFLYTRDCLILFLSIMIAFFVLNLFTKTKMGRSVYHLILLKTPLLGKLISYQNLANFLQDSAILADAGVPIVEAFTLASTSIENVILLKQTNKMIRLVEHGTAINLAMQQAGANFFVNDAIEMIAIGQEAGCLGQMLARVSQIYRQKFNTSLQLILSLVQPVLIICLGGLVALLIFAIYMPIFNMPMTIE